MKMLYDEDSYERNSNIACIGVLLIGCISIYKRKGSLNMSF